MNQWQAPPPGNDPQDPYGQQAPYGGAPQAPYGTGPNPYGPGPAGQYPAGPGPYGHPQQPYPPAGGSNATVVWAIGVVAVVVVVGVIATSVLLLTSGGGPDSEALPVPSTATTSAPAPTHRPNSPSTGPTPSAPTGPSDLSGVLAPSVKTALRGNTYKRLSTRGGSCVSNANPALRKILKAHPCSAPVTAALYSLPGKSIRVSLYIMQFDSAADAVAVSKATNSKASPGLISPPRSGAGYWTLSRTQGSRVVYSVACRSDGGSVGESTGPVGASARELGVEIANVLIWKT